jgi:hypothetical protein
MTSSRSNDLQVVAPADREHSRAIVARELKTSECDDREARLRNSQDSRQPSKRERFNARYGARIDALYIAHEHAADTTQCSLNAGSTCSVLSVCVATCHRMTSNTLTSAQQRATFSRKLHFAGAEDCNAVPASSSLRPPSCKIFPRPPGCGGALGVSIGFAPPPARWIGQK